MHAFKKSLNELTSFSFIFMLMWLSFVQMFYILLNNDTKEFASFANSMTTCFQILLGKFNTDAFVKSQSILPMPFFVLYNVIIVFIMINLMVSILIDGFDLARNDPNLSLDDPNMFDYLKKKFFSFIPFDKIKTRRGESKKPFVYVEFLQSLEKNIDKILEKFKRVKFFLFFEDLKEIIFVIFFFINIIIKSSLENKDDMKALSANMHVY